MGEDRRCCTDLNHATWDEAATLHAELICADFEHAAATPPLGMAEQWRKPD